MKIILSAIIFATSLLCGVQGSGQCIEASFCGCQLLDANNKSLFNITLDFADNKFVKHEEDILLEYKYTYSPCSKNSDCTESNATAETSAMCRHDIRDILPRNRKSIGWKDSVTYTVDDLVDVNIVATYMGPDEYGPVYHTVKVNTYPNTLDKVTSVVNLVCDKNDVSGTFKFVRHHEKIYYFKLSSSNFCIPAGSASVTITTTPSTNTTTPTVIPTTTSSMNTTTSKVTPTTTSSMNTTTPTVTPTTTSSMNTTTPTVTPTTTSSMNTTTPTVTPTTTSSMNTTTPTVTPTTTSSMNTMTPTVTPTTTSSMNTTTPTVIPTATSSKNTTTSTVKPTISPTVSPKTAGSKTSIPTSTTQPAKQGHGDKNRKTVLAVTLSIVGAFILFVVVLAIVYYVWRKKKQEVNKYEPIQQL